MYNDVCNCFLTLMTIHVAKGEKKIDFDSSILRKVLNNMLNDMNGRLSDRFA